ncbi:O-antigen ligase family protein [Enterobacteriaceae bacterium LUAb1]
MSHSRHQIRQIGVAVGLCLAILLYFPWGWTLHNGISVPEYAGWGLPYALFLIIACQSPLRFYRSWLLLGASVLLTLPLLWMSAQADIWSAACRIAALWTGVVIVCWLAAHAAAEATVKIVIRVTVFIGLLCALSVGVRLFFPGFFALWQPLAGGGWAPGGQLQPDLMSLLLSTALLATLHCWLFEKHRLMLPVLIIIMFSLTLCLRLSGLVTLAISCVLLLLVIARERRRHFLAGLAVMLLSSAAACLVIVQILHQPLRFVWPEGWSSLPLLLRACIALLAAHPLTGVGYGHFAGSLPDGIMLTGQASHWHPLFTTAHPGNEPLYWITEGGLIAAAGVLLLLCWGCRVFVQLWRQARQAGGCGNTGSEGLSLSLCALPILLATLAGTIWYQSPLHYLLFLAFTGISVACLPKPINIWQPAPVTRLTGRVLLLVAGLAGLWFVLTGTRVALAVQDARQTMGKEVSALQQARQFNPWYMPDEVGFALTIHQLQLFRQTHDASFLAHSESFFQNYLRRHPDPNVYSMYITMLDIQGKSADAERVYREAQKRVFWDVRFAPDDSAGSVSPP